jgi:hypothetical protein
MRVTVYPFTDAARLPTVRAGDAVVCATGGFVGRCIRGATASWANHACMVIRVQDNGLVYVSQETPRKGDVFSPITGLGITRGVLVRFPDAVPKQVAGAVAFAQRIQHVPYGFAALGADLFGRVTRLEVDFGIRDHMVCSTATTRAMERYGWIPPKSPEAMTPGDIAFAVGAHTFPDVEVCYTTDVIGL